MRHIPSVVLADPAVRDLAGAEIVGEVGRSPGWINRDSGLIYGEVGRSPGWINRPGPIYGETFDPDESSGPFHFPEPFDPANRQGMLDELIRKGYEKRGDKMYKTGGVTPDKAEEPDDRQASRDFLADFIDSMSQDQADLSGIFETAVNLGRGDRQDLSRRGAEGIFRPRGIG
jgi:hypothetical protein